MRKISIILFYLISGLIFLGGLGDHFINELLKVHLKFLGNPEPSELLLKSEIVIINMLHVIGGNLMAIGIGVFFLTHFGIRNDFSWAKWAFLIMVLFAEGSNAIGMYTVNSFYYFPLILIILTVIAVALNKRKSTAANNV